MCSNESHATTSLLSNTNVGEILDPFLELVIILKNSCKTVFLLNKSYRFKSNSCVIHSLRNVDFRPLMKLFLHAGSKINCKVWM